AQWRFPPNGLGYPQRMAPPPAPRRAGDLQGAPRLTGCLRCVPLLFSAYHILLFRDDICALRPGLWVRTRILNEPRISIPSTAPAAQISTLFHTTKLYYFLYISARRFLIFGPG